MAALVIVNMAAPMEGSVQENDSKLCEIEATVVTGFEQIALGEVKEKLGVKGTAKRGMITMQVPMDRVTKTTELQCTENVYVVLNHFKDFQFADTPEGALQQVEELVARINWAHGLNVWNKFFSFAHPISSEPQAAYTASKQTDMKPNLQTDESDKLDIQHLPNLNSSCSTPDNQNKASVTSVEPCTEEKLPITDSTDISSTQDDKPAEGRIPSVCPESQSASCDPPPAKVPKIINPFMPSFRATCYRSGKNHNFQSPEAARCFGGAMQDYFGWNVKMKEFDIEAVLIIDGNDIHVSISLNKESLHRRHIKSFGPTTLKPTIAYSMLRMCDISAGDVVIDPMCGGGTIPIEAAINWPSAIHVCGDVHDLAWPRCRENVEDLNQKRILKGRFPAKIDIIAWDVCRLPLHSESVDVFITDLPFGKRSGSRLSNWHLYPRALTEMARVAKRENGRACLLTCDKKCMIKTLQTLSSLWRRGPVASINMGGLAGMVFMLYRTTTNWESFTLPSNMPK